MTPDNGQVQIQFSEKRQGAAGDAERGSAKQDEASGRRREERERKVWVKDEAGREMERSAESSECVSRGKK